MERRYRGQINSVREDLIKFVSTKPCSSCGGSRLRLEARNVLSPILTTGSERDEYQRSDGFL